MKLLKITFWTALIIGIIFFPTQVIGLAILLFVMSVAVGFLLMPFCAFKESSNKTSSISDDDLIMMDFILKNNKRRKENNP